MTDNDLKRSLVEIGQLLIELRKKKGYKSHEGFALDYDLPRVQYWRMEKGKANFTIKSLSRILQIHGVSLTEFFIQLEPSLKRVA